MNRAASWDAVSLRLLWAYEGCPRTTRSSFCDRALYLTGWLVLQGGARVVHDGAATTAFPGEWLFPRPVPRMQEFEPETQLLSLALKAEWPDGRALFGGGPSVVLRAADHPTLERRARRLLHRADHRETVMADFAFRQALCGWAEGVAMALTAAGLDPRRPSFEDARLAELLRLLDACPLTERHPGHLLARQLGVSRVQLERLCSAALGRTARQYLDERRLDYARRALPLKLAKEVAAEIGFSHVSTFSTWYKRKTGTSPSLGV